MSTPNGRFETGKKICLSITGYHPEFWQPAWGSTIFGVRKLSFGIELVFLVVRTALLAIISFFPTKSEGAIGGLDWTPEERRTLATRYDFSSFFVPGISWLRSLSWSCAQCGVRMDTALPADSKDQSSADGGERKEPDSPSKSVDLSMFSFAYEKQATEEASSGSSSASTSVPKPVSSGNQGRDAGEIPTNTMAHSNRGEGSTVRQRPAALGAGVSGPSSVSASPARSPVSPTAVPREQTANMEAANRQRKIDAIIVFLAVIVGLLILRRFLAFLGPV